MAKKEPLILSGEPFKELSCMAKKLAGLRQTQLDIAERMGELNHDIWGKVHKIFPKLGDKRLSVDCETGEVTEAKDC